MKKLIYALVITILVVMFQSNDVKAQYYDKGCYSKEFHGSFIVSGGIGKAGMVNFEGYFGAWGKHVGGYIGFTNHNIQTITVNRQKDTIMSNDTKMELSLMLTGRIKIGEKLITSPFVSITPTNYAEYGIRQTYIVNPDFMIGFKASNRGFGLSMITTID